MTKPTRWLILLLSGTLLFGVLCFVSGLLLGFSVDRTGPHRLSLAPTKAALAVAAVPAVATPKTAAAPQAAAVKPAGTPIIPPAAVVPSAGAKPAAAPTAAPAAAAATPPAVGAAPAAAAAAPAFPVHPVTDLEVGVPADQEPASGLRGALVASAEAAARRPAAASPAPAAGGAAAATAPADPAPPPPSPPPPPKRGFAARVGAYLDPAAAQRRAVFLQQHGYQPLVLSSQQPAEGLTWYSVVLGQAAGAEAARRQADQFESDQQQRPEIVSWLLAPPAK